MASWIGGVRCDYRNEHRLDLQCSFQAGSGNSFQYRLRFYADGRSAYSETMTLTKYDDAHTFSATISRLNPNTSYSCYAVVYYRETSSSSWRVTSVESDTVSVLTYPECPSFITLEETSSETDSDCEVLITIDKGDNGSGNGITYYYCYDTRSGTKRNMTEFSGNSAVISGLAHDTTYYFTIFAGNNATEFDGVVGDTTKYRSLTTSARVYTPVINLIYPVVPTEAQYANGGSGRSIYVSVNAISGVSSYEWRYYTDEQKENNDYYNTTTTTNSTTLTNELMQPNTKYNVVCIAKYSSGSTSGLSTVQYTTTYAQPPTSVISCNRINNSQIQITLSNDGKYSGLVIHSSLASNGKFAETTNWTKSGNIITVNTSDSASRWFRIYVKNSTGLYDSNKYLSCESANPKPQLWDWDISNGEASALQTQNSYKALTNKEKTTNFNHLVFNDMCAKAKEILEYCEESWMDTYATYNNTLMVNYDYTLYAYKYNSLRLNTYRAYNAAAQKGESMPTPVKKGDRLMAYHLTGIPTKLNAGIEAL